MGYKNSCLWTQPDTAIYFTLAARGLKEHMQVSLIFLIIVSFMLYIVFTLANVLYFKEFLIHNSCGFMILKNN